MSVTIVSPTISHSEEGILDATNMYFNFKSDTYMYTMGYSCSHSIQNTNVQIFLTQFFSGALLLKLDHNLCFNYLHIENMR